MPGLYDTLNLASRSLQTQMTGVQIAGQNLANVDTTGYSRQTAAIETSPTIQTSAGEEGGGADVVGVQQVVSQLLNTQIQGQQSVSGYWTGQQTGLQDAQNSLDEFLNGGTASSTSATSSTSNSSTGLATQLSGLFADFQGLAASPTSMAARQAVVGQAQQVAAMFNSVSDQLTTLKTSLNSSLGDDITSANQLLTQIAGLNKQIANAQFSGGSANDLKDTREQDLEKLANLASIQTGANPDGTVDVSMGGQSLVSGNQVVDTLQTFDAAGGQMLVQTAKGGATLSLSGGTMQGTIDARDQTLASLQGGLDNLASTLISQVNGLHDSGYNLNGGSGAAFFEGSNAGNIAVNSAIASNAALVQASGSASASGDNSVALALANLASVPQANLNNQTFTASYAQTVAGLGEALQNANTEVTNQTSVGNMLSTQRNSISGVNIDEEMTNLMMFQRAYEASAQLVTTVNAMITTTIGMKTA